MRKGKLGGVTVMVRDETQRVEAQEARREREERMALALTADIVWDWDLRAGTLFLSPRWRDLVGDPGAQARAPADWLDRVHPDDQAQLRAAISTHLDGHSAGIEHEHRQGRPFRAA